MDCRCTRGAVGSPPQALDASMSMMSFAGPDGYPGYADRRQAERRRAPNSERTGSHTPAPKFGCLPTGTSSEEAVMKYAPTVLTTEPANGLICGIDWARDDHAVSVVDARGREVHRSTVEHSRAGLRALRGLLSRTGVAEVAIERPDGPLVDTLLAADITVVVISPNQLKNLRSRYGSTGNKDARFAAFALADPLRTARPRLRPLVPDTPATTALRTACRARKDLIGHRVAMANQLREHLNGAVGLFADIDSMISLSFLTRFDCQHRADWLTPTHLGT